MRGLAWWRGSRQSATHAGAVDWYADGGEGSLREGLSRVGGRVTSREVVHRQRGATMPDSSFVNPLSPNVTVAVGALLMFHVGAFLFWVASLFMQQRQAAADLVRAKRD